jgi:hypothetical protein
MSFFLIFCVVTSYGRINFGLAEAASNRYTLYSLIGIALLIITIFLVHRNLFQNYLVPLLSFTLVLTCLFPQQWGSTHAIQQINYGREVASLALDLDIPDPNTSINIYPIDQRVNKLASEMIPNDQSIFGSKQFTFFRTMISQPVSLPQLNSCEGTIDQSAKLNVNNVNSDYHFTGKLILPKHLNQGEIGFIDQSSHFVGFGLVDFADATSDPAVNGSNLTANFEGYVRSDNFTKIVLLNKDQQPVCLVSS